MTIRNIAKDLYRLRQEVEMLERQIESAPPDRKPELKDRLRKVNAEYQRMRRILEGSKKDPPYRKPR